MSTDKPGFLKKIFGKKSKGSTLPGPTTQPVQEASKNNKPTQAVEVKHSYTAAIFSYHPKGDSVRALWNELVNIASDETDTGPAFSRQLQRLLQEYNPNYNEWKDKEQLAEFGYYPHYTNMENNIAKWTHSDDTFAYFSDPPDTYHSSSKASLPAMSKEFANKLIDRLNNSFKAVKTKFDSSTLGGCLIDELYVLAILTRSPTNCETLLGDSLSSNRISAIDPPKLTFQVFGELMTITQDIQGELSNILCLIFFYSVVIVKNMGPVSRNLESSNFIGSRIVRQLSRLMTLVLNHVNSPKGTVEHSMSWREYSLFILGQQALAVTLRKRPDVMHHIREVKLLEELHIRFLGWPDSCVPKSFLTLYTPRNDSSEDETDNNINMVNGGKPVQNLSATPYLDPVCPIALKVSIFELLATAFLDLPSIQRWSAIGGFKAMIDTILWMAMQWMPQSERTAEMIIREMEPKPLKSTLTGESDDGKVRLAPLPSFEDEEPKSGPTLPSLPPLPGISASSSPDKSGLNSLPSVTAKTRHSIQGAPPLQWEALNVFVLRCFESFFRMSLCVEEDPFNERVFTALLSIFDTNVYNTSSNSEGREFIKLYPEVQLCFLCVINALIQRNPKCLKKLAELKLWTVILNSGFFILTSEQQAHMASTTIQYPNASKYLHGELSRYIFNTLEYAGCLTERDVIEEVAVLFTLLTSPHTSPNDLEHAALTLQIMCVKNPVATATAMVHIGKHKAWLDSDMAVKDGIDPTPAQSTASGPFLLTSVPTMDQRRKHSLSTSLCGFAQWLHLILKFVENPSDPRGTPNSKVQANNDKFNSILMTLNLALEKVISSDEIRQVILEDPLILNDMLLVMDDPHPHVCTVGINYVVARMRPRQANTITAGSTVNNTSGFFTQLSSRFLDRLIQPKLSLHLHYELAMMDAIFAISAGVIPESTETQNLLFTGLGKILRLLETVMSDQMSWTYDEVNEFVVATLRALGALTMKNKPNKETLNITGFPEIKAQLIKFASRHPLSKTILYELIRIMMDGNDEPLLACLGLRQMPNLFIRPPNPLRLVSFSAMTKTTFRSTTQYTNMPEPTTLPANMDVGDFEGSFVTTSMAPSPASSDFEHDEVIQGEAYSPPNPKAASTIIELLNKFGLMEQELALEVLLRAVKTQISQSASVTLSALCAEGVLSKALDKISEITDAGVAEKLFEFIGNLGGHSVSVKDISRMIALFKPIPGDYRPPWAATLLTSLYSMIDTNFAPLHYFHFDGVTAGLVIPPLPKFPLDRGFSMTSWIFFQDFRDPLGRPNYQPRIFSFLDSNFRGCELVVYQNHFQVLIHRDNNTDSYKLGKQLGFKSNEWYFLTLTYSVSTSLISKQGTFKLHIGEKFIDKVSVKQFSITDVKYCYIGSSYMPSEANPLAYPSQSGNTPPQTSTPESTELQRSYNIENALGGTNRTFYGYMSEITFYDEELTQAQIVAAKKGDRIEPTKSSQEWNSVFDSPPPAAASITMSYSPRSTTVTLTDMGTNMYSNTYLSDPGSKFKDSPEAEAAKKIAFQQASEISHICYDSSPACRDAVLLRGLHIVHRTQLRSLIGCVSGGSSILLPLFQLLDKPEELSASQLVARRERARHIGHHLQTSAAGVLPPNNLSHANSTDALNKTDSTKPIVKWSKAVIPSSLMRSDDFISSNASITTPALASHHIKATTISGNAPIHPGVFKTPDLRSGVSTYGTLQPRSEIPRAISTLDTGSPSLLLGILKVTLKVLHASAEIRQQMLSSRGYELISYLLIRANPANLTKELLDVLARPLIDRNFPNTTSENIIENMLLEFHLWIFTPYEVQLKLIHDTLPRVLSGALANSKNSSSSNIRLRLRLIPKILAIIRTYYWDTPNAEEVMASEPVINAVTGGILGKRPSLQHIRKLRHELFKLLHTVIRTEFVTTEEDLKRSLFKSEFLAILQFLKDCPDPPLLIDLMDFIEELYNTQPIYFERFIEFISVMGPSILLFILESRVPEIRAKTLMLINAVIQLKFLQDYCSKDPTRIETVQSQLPIVVTSNTALPSPLLDFPLSSVYVALQNKPVDQNLYDAMISLVFLLPPFYRGRYLIARGSSGNDLKGKGDGRKNDSSDRKSQAPGGDWQNTAALIRLWPMLSVIGRVLGGRHPDLQTIFIDDFSFLVTGNDLNLETMLSSVQSWPSWFLAACSPPISTLSTTPANQPNADSAASPETSSSKESQENPLPQISSAVSIPKSQSEYGRSSSSSSPNGSPLTSKSPDSLGENTAATPESTSSIPKSASSDDVSQSLSIIPSTGGFSAAISGSNAPPSLSLSASPPPSTTMQSSPRFSAVPRATVVVAASEDKQKLQRLQSKAVDSLKNIALRILTTKSGNQLFVEWFCWFRVHTVRVDDDDSDRKITVNVAEAEFFENIFFATCAEIISALNRECRSQFSKPGVFSSFLSPNSSESGPSVIPLGGVAATKKPELALSNSICAVIAIAEYALASWSTSSSLADVHISSDIVSSGSYQIPGSSSTSTGSLASNVIIGSSLNQTSSQLVARADEWDEPMRSIAPVTQYPEFSMGLLKFIHSLDDILDRVPGISPSSPTEILTFKAKSGFRGPAGIPLILLLLAVVIRTKAKNSDFIECLNNSGHILLLSNRKPNLLEVCYALLISFRALLSRYSNSSPTVLDKAGKEASQTWSAQILGFISSIIENADIRAMLNKNLDPLIIDFMRKFGKGADLTDLCNQPLVSGLMGALQRELYDFEKRYSSSRKAAVSVLSKLTNSYRNILKDESKKDEMFFNFAIETAHRVTTKFLTPLGRALHPKDIIGDYTRTAYRWRDLLRVLRGEIGPWGNNKPTIHWKLSNTESSNRMRPFFKKNHHFNDHKDASKQAKGAKPPVRADQALSSSVRRTSLYHTEGRKDEDANNESVEIPLNPLDADDDFMGRTNNLERTPSTINNATRQLSTLRTDGAGFYQSPNVVRKEFTDVMWIRPMQVIKGVLSIYATELRFKPESHVGKKHGKNAEQSKKLPRERSWYFESVTQLRLRRYLLQPNALELFFSDRTTTMFAFSGQKVQHSAFSTLAKYSPVSARCEPNTPEQEFRTSDATKRWQNRELSNFDYLMELNTMAGRTYNDLSQYPVFPWIIKDMTSSSIDLNNPETFRDLSKPIGALTENRLNQFIARYETFSDDELKYFYGTHYSTAAIVLYFMIRVEPFTTMAIELQDGSFDISDRMFNSLTQCWQNCMTSTSDVKELTPEFYYMPEFLLNTNNFNLGTLHTGEQAGDVSLPPWASSAEDFVRIMRRALESDYVSEHLHEWIDLIFGYKQNGDEAVASYNLFHYMSYEGTVNLNDITDPMERDAAETTIREFGQIPSQLLRKPHPPRGTVQIPECMLTEFSVRKDEQFAVGKGRIGWVGCNSKGGIYCIDAGGRLHCNNSNLAIADSRLPNETPASFRPSYEMAPRIAHPHIPHNGRTCCYVSSVNMIFSGLNEDYSIRRFNVDQNKFVPSYFGHNDVVTCLAVSENGKVVVSGSRDTTVRIWDPLASSKSSGTSVIERSFNAHDDEVVCVAVHYALGIVVSSSKDAAIIIHDLFTGAFMASIHHPQKQIFDLIAISGLGFVVAFSNAAQKIYTYTMNGRLLRQEDVTENPKALLITRDGEFIITCGKKAMNYGCVTVRRINVDGTPSKYPPATTPFIKCGTIWSMAYTSDESYLIFGTDNGSIIVQECPSKRFYIRWS